MRCSPFMLAAAAAAVILAALAHAQTAPRSALPLQPRLAVPSQPQASDMGATATTPDAQSGPGGATVTGPSVTGPNVTGQAPWPGFSVGGWPVTINSPTAPPYGDSAYGNLGGQPQRSGDWLLNWRRDRD
jgi:hypothetical protein